MRCSWPLSPVRRSCASYAALAGNRHGQLCLVDRTRVRLDGRLGADDEPDSHVRDGTKRRPSAALLVPVQPGREETMRRTLIITTLCCVPACGPQVLSSSTSSGAGGAGSGTGLSGIGSESSNSESAGTTTGSEETGSIPEPKLEETGEGTWEPSTGGTGDPSECERSESYLRFAPENDIPALFGAFQGVAVGWCDVEIRSVQEWREGFLSTLVASCEHMSGRREWELFSDEVMELQVRLSSSEDPSSLFDSIPPWARVRVATEPESPGAGRQSWLVVEHFEGVAGPADPPGDGLRYPVLAVTQAETIEPSPGLLNDVFDDEWYGGMDLRFAPSSCHTEQGWCGEVPSALEVSWEDGDPVVLEGTQSKQVVTRIPETLFRTWLSSAWVTEEPQCTDMPGSSLDFAQVVVQP